VLLAAIACAAFLSTFAGGILAYRLQDKLHLILGFSAGAVLGVAFFDLLPEALTFGGAQDGASRIVAWSACGFLLYLVLDRVLLFHGAVGAAPAHVAAHVAAHAAGHADEPGVLGAERGLLGAGILCTHSFLDGAAIGVAFQASHAVGMVVAIAVLTHDFSDGINTMNIVLKNRGERRQALSWLLADALAPAAGVASTLFFALPSGDFGVVLALFAGFFLYIGASDLIPESYHAHPKFLTTAMTLAGAAVLYLAMSLAASAATIAGVRIDDTAQVGPTTLVLNGAGKRTKLIFDVYVAGLYLPARTSDGDEALREPGPKRISMTLMRNLSAAQLIDALREGLSRNNAADQLARLQPQIDSLVKTMTAAGAADSGDVLTLDFLADGTTRVGRNGKVTGDPIAGADFQRALLGVWLGAKPVQEDLKKSLLGG
jgi:ZIP family zinc transporter